LPRPTHVFCILFCVPNRTNCILLVPIWAIPASSEPSNPRAQSCFQEEWPALIIVPAALRLVWAEELERWLPHVRPSQIHIVEGKADRLQVAFDRHSICQYRARPTVCWLRSTDRHSIYQLSAWLAGWMHAPGRAGGRMDRQTDCRTDRH
jgi:hypothetical protein